MTFLELAEKVLKETAKPLTPREIWDYAISKGYDKDINSKGKTPWFTINAQLYVDLKNNAHSKFMKVGKGSLFTLKSFNPSTTPLQETIIVKPNKEIKSDYHERDLHPFLAYFGSKHQIYTKTILHEMSSKKEFSEWTHPDMVGCNYTLLQWEPAVSDFSKGIGSISIKLYSFEIKKCLDFLNLRASFFQAVSNSSWAHEGYLVAAEIAQEGGFHDELKRLCSSFGIGIIKLEVDNPDNSMIIYPAKSKEILDWDTMNKLARINKNFLEFLNRVKDDVNTKTIIEERYDRILTRDELSKRIHK
jgi:uncharacterized protein